MEEKKEVQETIISLKPVPNAKVSEEEFSNILKMVAPGTNLRAALDGALKSGRGALIAIENQILVPIMDGGFRINCRFTPQRLIELAKMDGAIILSNDLKKINYSNVLLTPSSLISTSETGTRHKAAERTAKQIGGLAIAISEKKHDITLFYKNKKHLLQKTEEILRKSNEKIQILERQRELFDKHIENLNHFELNNYHSVHHVVVSIQKGRLIQKIAKALHGDIIELGNEGTILKTRLKELMYEINKELDLVIKDYTRLDLKKSRTLLESLSYSDILEQKNILRILAYENSSVQQLKGWRILSKTSLEDSEIALIIKRLGTLGKIIHSDASTLASVIGEEKASVLRDEIDRLKFNISQK